MPEVNYKSINLTYFWGEKLISNDVESSILDLRTNGELSAKDSKLIDLLGKDVRKEYDSYIGSFIEINNLTGIELLLAASCRNTLVSKIHDSFCRIALLEENIKQGHCPDYVKVDNPSVAAVMGRVLTKHGCSNTKIDCQKRNTNIIILILQNIIKCIYVILNSWLWSRLFFRKVKPKGKVLFVDTFLFNNSIDKNGHYHDRYYTGHESYLNKQELDMLWFAPTLYGIRHPLEYIQLFRQVSSADRNFLLKEAWLTRSDYLFSLFYSFVIPFKVRSYPSFHGIDVSAVVKRDVLFDIASLSLFRALCNYRFIRRLSKENIDICGAVNWFENQVNDRALNISFNHYYPKVLVRGYQGFMLIDYYASLQPTLYEFRAATLPSVLHVINEGCLLLHRGACEKLPLKLAPAFRFAHLFDLKDRRTDGEKIVLIPLPGAGMDDDSIGIIRNYLSIADRLKQNVRVLVKPHPSYTIDQFKRLAPELSDQRLEYTDKDMSELLELTSVMISTASSACVEAVAVGIPVAIYGSRSGVTMNPIPANVPKDLWDVFYTSKQLVEFLLMALEKKERASIVSELFHAIDAEGTRALFASDANVLERAV